MIVALLAATAANPIRQHASCVTWPSSPALTHRAYRTLLWQETDPLALGPHLRPTCRLPGYGTRPREGRARLSTPEHRTAPQTDRSAQPPPWWPLPQFRLLRPRGLASSGLKPRSGSATRSLRTASRRAPGVQGLHMPKDRSGRKWASCCTARQV